MINRTAYSQHRFAVAPMLDWTDRHCRYFHRLLSKKALLYTEMRVADAILYGDRKHLLAFSDCEQPVALQLGGSDIKKLCEAAKIAESFGYSEINLNVGCPSDRVQAGSFGASLMAEPQKVGQIVEALKNAVSVPVTVKCRIGIDEQEPHLALTTLGEYCVAAGVDAFWVHARKAWLKGLSPKDNRNLPPLDYPCVYAFKQAFPNLFVGLNGGIASLEEAKDHLDYVDGVMMGRAAYHNPRLLLRVDSLFFQQPARQTDYFALLENIVCYAQKQMANNTPLTHVLHALSGLFNGLQGAKLWRSTLAHNKADILTIKKLFTEIVERNNLIG